LARSSYIYVLEDITTNRAIAAFTVKHECISFWERHYDPAERDYIECYRIPDGRIGDPVPVKLKKEKA